MSEAVLFTLRIVLHDGRNLLFCNLDSQKIREAQKSIWQQGITRRHNSTTSELISPQKIKTAWMEMQSEVQPLPFKEIEANAEAAPLTAKEQYDLLCEINPLVEDLKNRLKLQLGY